MTQDQFNALKVVIKECDAAHDDNHTDYLERFRRRKAALSAVLQALGAAGVQDDEAVLVDGWVFIPNYDANEFYCGKLIGAARTHGPPPRASWRSGYRGGVEG